MNLDIFPPLNASLNTATAILLTAGYVLIRYRRITAHKACMILATATSAVFLVCYLYYHAHHGVTRYAGQGWLRTVYFTVLGTHTILAAIQVPLILLTLFRAFKGPVEKHRSIARITLPIWLYVSVTGVIIYWMLYRL